MKAIKDLDWLVEVRKGRDFTRDDLIYVSYDWCANNPSKEVGCFCFKSKEEFYTAEEARTSWIMFASLNEIKDWRYGQYSS